MLRRQQWSQAADEAQRHWYVLLDDTVRATITNRSAPPTLEGRPVKVYYTLTVNFEH